MHDLDCSRIVGNDQEYIRLKAKKRISYVDQPALETDCESIKARNYFPTEATSEEERDFGIAFSKTVFKVIELPLKMPQLSEYLCLNLSVITSNKLRDCFTEKQ